MKKYIFWGIILAFSALISFGVYRQLQPVYRGKAYFHFANSIASFHDEHERLPGSEAEINRWLSERRYRKLDFTKRGVSLRRGVDLGKFMEGVEEVMIVDTNEAFSRVLNDSIRARIRERQSLPQTDSGRNQ